eukprot:TRINITY_DN2380_c1_g1_i1.p1 TRINITY_DN2380_c1_g1~~TRINITY_DN2380_c1_g1_i1.p1  ORF type:complete len:948 (+),score=150.42 TRINITY_DN2380_c1_g1_i1:32-2845(+)
MTDGSRLVLKLKPKSKETNSDTNDPERILPKPTKLQFKLKLPVEIQYDSSLLIAGCRGSSKNGMLMVAAIESLLKVSLYSQPLLNIQYLFELRKLESSSVRVIKKQLTHLINGMCDSNDIIEGLIYSILRELYQTNHFFSHSLIFCEKPSDITHVENIFCENNCLEEWNEVFGRVQSIIRRFVMKSLFFPGFFNTKRGFDFVSLTVLCHEKTVQFSEMIDDMDRKYGENLPEQFFSYCCSVFSLLQLNVDKTQELKDAYKILSLLSLVPACCERFLASPFFVNDGSNKGIPPISIVNHSLFGWFMSMGYDNIPRYMISKEVDLALTVAERTIVVDEKITQKEKLDMLNHLQKFFTNVTKFARTDENKLKKLLKYFWSSICLLNFKMVPLSIENIGINFQMNLFLSFTKVLKKLPPLKAEHFRVAIKHMVSNENFPLKSKYSSILKSDQEQEPEKVPMEELEIDVQVAMLGLVIITNHIFNVNLMNNRRNGLIEEEEELRKKIVLNLVHELLTIPEFVNGVIHCIDQMSANVNEFAMIPAEVFQNVFTEPFCLENNLAILVASKLVARNDLIPQFTYRFPLIHLITSAIKVKKSILHLDKYLIPALLKLFVEIDSSDMKLRYRADISMMFTMPQLTDKYWINSLDPELLATAIKYSFRDADFLNMELRNMFDTNFSSLVDNELKDIGNNISAMIEYITMCLHLHKIIIPKYPAIYFKRAEDPIQYLFELIDLLFKTEDLFKKETRLRVQTPEISRKLDAFRSMLSIVGAQMIGRSVVSELVLRKILNDDLNENIIVSFLNCTKYDGDMFTRLVTEKSNNIDRLTVDLILNFVRYLETKKNTIITEDAIFKELEGDIPFEYLDVLTYALMRDPVKLPSSGIIVEREMILELLNKEAVDPMNRTPLDPNDLIDMPALKKEIEEWKLKAIDEFNSHKKSPI